MSQRFFRKALLILALSALLALASDADGKWSGELRLTVPRLQTRLFTMELKANAAGRVSGTIADESGNDKVEILDGQIDHDEISFDVPTGAADMPRFEFRGKYATDTIAFTISGIDPRTSTLITLGEATAKRAR
jgi:hypothetical protein